MWFWLYSTVVQVDKFDWQCLSEKSDIFACCYFKNLHLCMLNQRLIFPKGPSNQKQLRRRALMYNIFEILQIYSLIPKDQKKNIIRTMNYVRGDFSGPAHGTKLAAVIANKSNCRSFGNSKTFKARR